MEPAESGDFGDWNVPDYAALHPGYDNMKWCYSWTMVNYRRLCVPGGTYFFTVNLFNRRSVLLTEHIPLLREAFRSVRLERPFEIVAVVILPDHLHAVMTLPPGDDDYSGRWQAIKSRFTCSLVEKGVGLTKNGKGEYDLWQRRFWEHTIRDETDLNNHVAYVHYNPVKHGWVERVKDWPFSSFHRYVKKGLLDENWGSAPIEFGELEERE